MHGFNVSLITCVTFNPRNWYTLKLSANGRNNSQHCRANIVGSCCARVGSRVCIRMQQLPTMLGPAVHHGKDTIFVIHVLCACVVPTMLEELCKWIQHCYATLRRSRNKRNVGSCWLKCLTGFKLSRLRVVPYFSSGIVERAKRERA